MTAAERPSIAAETIAGHRFQKQPEGALAHVCPPGAHAAPRTLEEVETLLKQAPSTRDRLLEAAKAVLAKARDIDHIEIVTVGAKAALDALSAAVRDCERGKP